MPDHNPSAPRRAAEPDLFDYALLRDYVTFAARAPLRHGIVAAATFLAVVGITALALWALPKTYRVETRILAQRNPMMSTLANPSFGRPWEADAPTRAARETVLRWDNLVSLVEQTHLVDRYMAQRSPAARAKDALLRFIQRRQPTREEMVDALAFTLERKLAVSVGDGLVVITVEWSNGETAYLLLQAALQSFLETRHASEISIVGEAISILEGHLGDVQRDIDATVAELVGLRRQQHPNRIVTTRRVPARPSEDHDVVRLRTMLAAKHRAIADLEEFRRRRLSELEAQLAQQQLVFAERHPSIVATRQDIESASAPSAQLDTLRSEVADLERELVRRGAAHVSEPAAVAAAPEEVNDRGGDDPRVEYVTGKLRLLYGKYSTLLERIDGARMEMDTAQAAFKYRYSVVAPPQMPKSPVRPSRAKVIPAAVLAGLLLAFAVATLVDVLGGRIVEPWQVERSIGVPVLARVRH
jgi:uncharacterized protein involved in exopolysaccharide biosynthesis